MEYGKGDIVGVAFHGLDTTFTKVIPHFDSLVVPSCHKIWFIGSGIKIDVVDAFVMCVHREIGCGGAEGPHFDGAIEACGCECICVFGVYGDVHDVVCMPFVHLHERKTEA